MAVPPSALAQGLLADPAELADLLGVPADTPRLLAALRAASRRMRGAADASFTPVTGAEFWGNGDGSVTLLLPVMAVRAVTLVEVDGAPVTDFEWSHEGILRRLCGWPDRLRSVRAVVDHGYTAVPEDVQDAVLDQAEAGYTTRKGVQSVSVDGQSVTYGAASQVGVTQTWSDVVARYSLRGDRA